MPRWREPGHTRPKENKRQKRKKVKAPPPPRSAERQKLLNMPKPLRKKAKKRIIKNFMTEARMGNLENVKHLIDAYRLSPNVITKALNQAVNAGNLHSVRTIITYPQSKRWGWFGGFYMLQNALVKGHVEIAKLLLYKGMRVVMKKRQETTPLQLAVATRDVELVQLVSQSNLKSLNWAAVGGWTPLHEAVDTGDYRMVEMLLQYGAVPKSDEYKFEPLHVACLKQYHDMIHLLLSQHTPSSPFSLNLALLIAAGGEGEDIVRYLLQAGADPNFSMPCDLIHSKYAFCVKFGWTPLYRARNNCRIQGLLLDFGAAQYPGEERAIPSSSATGEDTSRVKNEVNPDIGDGSLTCTVPIKTEQNLDLNEDSLKNTLPVKTESADVGEGGLTCTVPIKTEQNLDLNEYSLKNILPVKTESADVGEGGLTCTVPIKTEQNLDLNEDSLKNTLPVKTESSDVGEGGLTCTVPIKTEQNLDLNEDSLKNTLPVKTENADVGEGSLTCTSLMKTEKNLS